MDEQGKPNTAKLADDPYDFDCWPSGPAAPETRAMRRARWADAMWKVGVSILTMCVLAALGWGFRQLWALIDGIRLRELQVTIAMTSFAALLVAAYCILGVWAWLMDENTHWHSGSGV